MKSKELFYLCARTMLVVLFLALWRAQALAQCSDEEFLAELKTVSATTNKCGFYELCTPSVPPKIYLVSKQSNSGSFSLTSYGGPDDLDYYSEEDASYVTTATTTYNNMDCSMQISLSGDANTLTIWTTDLHSNDANFYQSATISDHVVGTWSDGGTAYAAAQATVGYGGTGLALTSSTHTANCSMTMTQSIDSASGSYADTESGYDWTQTITSSTVLANEFTDPMLRLKAIAYLPAYPATWTIVPGSSSLSSASYTFFDANHYSATVSKMQYRFRIIPSIKDAVYKVEWDEITTYPSGSTSTQHITENVTGTGDPINGVATSTHEKQVPGTPSIITVANGAESIEAIKAPSPDQQLAY